MSRRKRPSPIPAFVALLLLLVQLGAAYFLIPPQAETVAETASSNSDSVCPDNSQCQDECDKNPETCWKQLWVRLEEEGLKALDPTSQVDKSLRAAGDTCGMRYRDFFKELTEAQRYRFKVAAFSNTPQTKLALLQTLTEDGHDLVRFRAYLEIARIHIRQQHWPIALQALAKAEGLAVPSACQSDRNFLRGYVAFQQGRLDQAEQHLREATALDPGFWNARQLLLSILSRQLQGASQDNRQCLNRTRLLVENLGALPQLAQDSKQFRVIAEQVSAISAKTNSAISLIRGLGYLWGGDTQQAITVFQAGIADTGQLPQHCESLVQQRLSIELAKVAS